MRFKNMRRIISISFFLSILFLLLPQNVRAHQSGCHRWHSCPSDSGSYVCGDAGHPCQYGTYSYGNTQSYYSLPIPVNPSNGDYTYIASSQNWCNYDVTATWDKPSSGDRYSVAIGKSAGTDPGPNVDTTLPSYTFQNIAPGTWYVNLKTGNAERWTIDKKYLKIDLPTPTSSLKASIVGNNLTYSISCLTKVEGPEFFTKYLTINRNESRGNIALPVVTEPTSLTIKGWDKKGKEYVQTLTYNPPQPTASVQVSDSQTSKSNDDDDSLILGISIVGVLFGCWWLYKQIS